MARGGAFVGQHGNPAERARKKTLFLALRHGFSFIASWQIASFSLLLLLVWVNEIMDLPAFFFGLETRPFSLYRGCTWSAGVILVMIITVGHTYVQQRRIIGGMLTVCSYCHKIRIDKDAWERIEEYISRQSAVTLTHGICPDCYEKVTANWEKEQDATGESQGNAS